MTEVDVHDVQRVRRASGLLRDFNDVGVLGAADVHVATRLGRLTGETDDRVLLAVALAVRALRSGSVCLDVATARETTAVEDVDPATLAGLAWPPTSTWLAALEASPMVAPGVDGDPSRPVRLVEGLLYLDRYWRQEQRIATLLDEAALRPQPAVSEDRLVGRQSESGARGALGRLFPDDVPDRQRLAAVVAAHRWVSVLAGGPGTGKTTTVAKLLALLQDQADGSLRIALAAPTAVAAARLTFAARAVAERFDAEDRERLGRLEASTLHRLLGHRPGSRTRFRHDRENRLPFDVVVVDEASMVSLTMMSRLVDALRPDCRLLLVGDPDQLASVEAGAVLGDLVQRSAPPGAAALPGIARSAAADLADLDEEERRAALDRGVVRLSTVHRFSGEIQSFAEAVRGGNPDRVFAVLDEQHPSIEFVDTDEVDGLRADVVSAGRRVHEAASSGDGDAALRALAAHRLLCAHREGPYGVADWGERVAEWLRPAIPGYGAGGTWYVGRPLLVTSNDYQLRLFNGDTGVVVDVDGRPRAAFLRNGVIDLLAPSRLSDVQTVHAMSVHRSQGSQFDRVTLLLPPAESPLLTRELLYTGLTRAKEHVRLIGTREALATAVRRPIVRASGLRTRR
jgi:exodeoxyribonuclease V alpha subunit